MASIHAKELSQMRIIPSQSKISCIVTHLVVFCRLFWLKPQRQSLFSDLRIDFFFPSPSSFCYCLFFFPSFIFFPISLGLFLHQASIFHYNAALECQLSSDSFRLLEAFGLGLQVDCWLQTLLRIFIFTKFGRGLFWIRFVGQGCR